MTGYPRQAFPHFESNISPPRPDGDSDVTRGNDQHTIGRTRGRMYFNIIASDDLRAVFGFELDAVWGRNPDGAAFSFDRNTDMAGNIETKWLYVDFRIPQLPDRQSHAPGRDAPLCHAAAWPDRSCTATWGLGTCC